MASSVVLWPGREARGSSVREKAGGLGKACVGHALAGAQTIQYKFLGIGSPQANTIGLGGILSGPVHAES